MPDHPLFQVEQLTFQAIESTSGRHQTWAFVESLDEVQARDLAVAARVLATSLAAGRPPSGRAERIVGSKAGLYELRITPRGRRGAHARMLYIREGMAIRCVLGVLKRERLTRKDIQRAERILRNQP